MRPHHSLILLLSVSFSVLAAAHCIPRNSVDHRHPNLPPCDSPKTPHGSTDPIKALCEKTDFPMICESSARAYLAAHSGVHPEAILKAQISAIKVVTQTALGIAAKVSADPMTTKIVKDILDGVCTPSYTSALDDYESALAALVGGDLPTAKTNLDAAVTDYQTCEDGFNEVFMEMPGASPMTGFDLQLAQMASNCLVLYSLFH